MGGKDEFIALEGRSFQEAPPKASSWGRLPQGYDLKIYEDQALFCSQGSDLIFLSLLKNSATNRGQLSQRQAWES